jgi:release factor glutamine methyltransferase
VTVLEAIKRSAEFLEKKGVESARLNAELLLAHVLSVPRMRLYLAFERVLTEQEIEALRGVVTRRGKREPLQQITGTTSFCGYEIAVNPGVLTPRPETEVLAETAFELLTAINARGISAPAVLDIGTGSGCLAIAIALRFPEASVIGADCSPEALQTAEANRARHGLESRVKLLRSDLFSDIPAGTLFDLIVSNPPYIPREEIKTLQPEVRQFEPHLALDGGPDGLDFYRRLASEAGSWLKENGPLILEFGDGQAPELEKLFAAQNWIVEPPREDYTRRQRILVAYRNQPGAT